MRKLFALTLLFSLILFILPPKPAFSQATAVECDLCGWCPAADPTPPSNWASCAKCLYPTLYPLTPVPDGRTLQTDPATGEPIKAQKGRFYSFLGCINTDLTSFQEEGAAVSVVQTLSNLIFGLVGVIAFLYLIYGGFILATSQADPERINYGKYIIKRAIIGLVFSLLAFLIIDILASRVLGLPWFGG